MPGNRVFITHETAARKAREKAKRLALPRSDPRLPALSALDFVVAMKTAEQAHQHAMVAIKYHGRADQTITEYLLGQVVTKAEDLLSGELLSVHPDGHGLDFGHIKTHGFSTEQLEMLRAKLTEPLPERRKP